ncbi:hypothetical protein D3C84_983290 [compost metagenome]
MLCVDAGFAQRAFIPVTQRDIDGQRNVEERAFRHRVRGLVRIMVYGTGDKAFAENTDDGRKSQNPDQGITNRNGR